MKKKGRRPVKSNDLRKRAEDKLKGKTASFKKLAGNDAAKLIHDLEVYQIELEMQNDELRRSQIELEESRHRYSDLYDFAPMGYFVLDKNGIIVEVNLAGAVLVGAERKNLLKKPFALCIGKEYRDGFYLARRKVLQAGVCRRFDLALLRKDGREFFADLFIEPVKGADGKITQCRLAVIDITTRRKAEDEVKDLAKFPEENPFPVLRLSGDGTVLYSNNPGKVLLEQWGTVAGGKAPEDWRMAISRSLKSKKNLVKEIKCGDELFSIVIAPVTDGLCANLYGRNITLLRHKAGLLRKNEQRFKLLSEIAGKLLRSKNPQRLIESLCFKLMEYLDCHTFFNYLVDDEKQCLHLNSHAGIPEETAESAEWLQYDKEICGCVIREGKCFIAENIPETGDPRTDLVKSFGIKAYACHPFIAKGHVIGTLSFGTRTRTTFSKEDLSLMKVVADQLATALDRARSKEALLESEEKLQSQYAEIESIYNTAVVGLCVFDGDLRYVRINQHMAEMNGLTIEEHIGKTPQEIVPELAPIMQKLGRKVLLTRKPLLDIEFTGRTSANPDEQRYWKQQWLPIKDDDGIVTGINIVAEDITSDRQMEEALRKSRDELEMRVKERTAELAKIVNTLQEEVFQRIKTEEDLKESEQRYRSLTVATTQIVWTADAKGRVVNDIPSWRNFTGQRVEAAKGRGWLEALHPDDRKPTMKIWSQAVRNRSFYQTEYRIRRNDGKYRYMAVRGVPVQEEDGSIVEWVGTCDDITERKEMENRRHITNALLTLFVQKTSRKEYLDSVVEIIGRLSGCRCVGIRLTNADGYIPYKAYTGFCEEFLTLESKLSLNEDVCACIRVVTNRPDPQDAVVMTEKGSFRCDNTFNFVDSLSENEKKRFRGNCLHAGFASVAVVPVRYRQNILGAIHLADEQENKVPLETVEFLEEMAAMIGEAVYRFSVEESLRLNEGRLLEAQRLAHLGNWEWNIAKGTLWWSDEVYRIFGLEPQQFGATYEAFLSYVHPDDRKLVDESVDRALREGIEYNIEHRVIRPDGNERIVNEKARVIYDARHKPIKMAGTVYDITEQKNAEQELHEKQKQLRALAAQLQIVEEKERRRIARDLHDSIGQILAFSSRELDTIQKSLPDKMAQSLREIINQLDNAIVQTRTLSFDLSPSTLYDFGFEIAVEDLLDRIAKEKNIQCQYENCPGAKPLAEDVKVLLYRSVRELLINAVKHADSSLIKVSIFRSGSVIYVKVEDNGRGFDVSVLESGSRRSGGFGLFSVRERLNQIGGRLKMESAQGKGTKAVLTAPLDLEEGN